MILGLRLLGFFELKWVVYGDNRYYPQVLGPRMLQFFGLNRIDEMRPNGNGMLNFNLVYLVQFDSHLFPRRPNYSDLAHTVQSSDNPLTNYFKVKIIFFNK